MLYDRIGTLLAEPWWSLLDQEAKQGELDKTAKASRAIARELLRGNKSNEERRSLSPGFEVVPPIPEGFELAQ